MVAKKEGRNKQNVSPAIVINKDLSTTSEGEIICAVASGEARRRSIYLLKIGLDRVMRVFLYHRRDSFGMRKKRALVRIHRVKSRLWQDGKTAYNTRRRRERWKMGFASFHFPATSPRGVMCTHVTQNLIWHLRRKKEKEALFMCFLLGA